MAMPPVPPTAYCTSLQLHASSRKGRDDQASARDPERRGLPGRTGPPGRGGPGSVCAPWQRRSARLARRRRRRAPAGSDLAHVPATARASVSPPVEYSCTRVSGSRAIRTKTAAMPASATQVSTGNAHIRTTSFSGRLALQPAAQPQLGDGDEDPDDQDHRADHVEQPREDVVGPPVAEQHAQRSRRRRRPARRSAAPRRRPGPAPSGPGRGPPASRPCARSRRCWRSSRTAARPARRRS